jgi:hypothetical protein
VVMASEMRSTFALSFSHPVCDLVPQDRRQAIQAKRPRTRLNVGVKWHDPVATITLARNAHVPYHTADAATLNQNSLAMPPNLIELAKEFFILDHVA